MRFPLRTFALLHPSIFCPRVAPLGACFLPLLMLVRLLVPVRLFLPSPATAAAAVADQWPGATALGLISSPHSSLRCGDLPSSSTTREDLACILSRDGAQQIS